MISQSGSEAVSKAARIVDVLIALAIMSCDPGSAWAGPGRAAMRCLPCRGRSFNGFMPSEPRSTSKADAGGQLVWTFREPIASLMSGGRTVGRHFAGPSWEMADGSRITAKVVAQAAAPSPGSVPWLKLDVSDRKGSEDLDGVTVVQRVETSGGQKSGPCPASGEFWAEPYAADYLFSRP